MDYEYSMEYTQAVEPAATAALGGFLAVVLIISLIMTALCLACMWKLFIKAGYEGWKCLIPFYNMFCLFEMTCGNGWLMLLGLVPFVNFLVPFFLLYKLSVSFGKGIGFTAALVFVPVIALPILAFGNAEYLGV